MKVKWVDCEKNMTKKNFYAVAVGKQPGIYKSWYEAEKQVKGFKGAVFKGFAGKSEAKAYIAKNKPKEPEKPPQADTLPKSRGRWWLLPEYDKRLTGGAWNPKYS